jgi:hypothetical protein
VPDSTLTEIKKLQRMKHAKTLPYEQWTLAANEVLLKIVQNTAWEETLQEVYRKVYLEAVQNKQVSNVKIRLLLNQEH